VGGRPEFRTVMAKGITDAAMARRDATTLSVVGKSTLGPQSNTFGFFSFVASQLIMAWLSSEPFGWTTNTYRHRRMWAKWHTVYIKPMKTWQVERTRP
jgi:hypothetical protein